MTIKSAALRSFQTLFRLSTSIYHDLLRPFRWKHAKRRIVIDCGANTCDALRRNIKRFGNCQYYAFEPQPELAGEGEKVIAEYPDMDITFSTKAVWIRDESLDFYLATRWGSNYKGGSTLITGHAERKSGVDYDNPVRVEAIDFSGWLSEHVSENDYVIVKMDIEGAEYDVLEKIIEDNRQHLIDELLVEFHWKKNESIGRERHRRLVAKLRESVILEPWN